MSRSSDPPREQLPDHPTRPPVVLAYHSPPIIGPTLTIGTVGNEAEAQLVSDALADAGIPCLLLNRHSTSLGAFAGNAVLKIQVEESRAAAARKIFDSVLGPAEDLEPADDADQPTPLDKTGQPLAVEVVGSYDNPTLLFDAAASLGAARVQYFLPALVPRGDRALGSGKRFLLRVEAEDAPRARTILKEMEAEERSEPRCPQCSSWRVTIVPRGVQNLLRFITARSALPEELECLRCHHRWTAS